MVVVAVVFMVSVQSVELVSFGLAIGLGWFGRINTVVGCRMICGVVCRC